VPLYVTGAASEAGDLVGKRIWSHILLSGPQKVSRMLHSRPSGWTTTNLFMVRPPWRGLNDEITRLAASVELTESFQQPASTCNKYSFG